MSDQTVTSMGHLPTLCVPDSWCKHRISFGSQWSSLLFFPLYHSGYTFHSYVILENWFWRWDIVILHFGPQLAYKCQRYDFVPVALVLFFSCSPSQHHHMYRTCMCIVPASKQIIRSSDHNAGLAPLISGIDSVVKLQAKSHLYVSRYQRSVSVSWRDYERKAILKRTAALWKVLIILFLCEVIQQGFLLCAWKSAIEVRLS